MSWTIRSISGFTFCPVKPSENSWKHYWASNKIRPVIPHPKIRKEIVKTNNIKSKQDGCSASGSKNSDHKKFYKIFFYLKSVPLFASEAVLGEGAGFVWTLPPPSKIRPPADPKGPPFVLFWDIHFWLTDPKTFLKAPLAPSYTNFEGSARRKIRKTRNFLVEIFQKAPKTSFLACFFKSLLAAQKIRSNYRVFIVFWNSSENQFGRPKKRSTPSRNC